jgi:circadian clock protein KaiB
MTSYDLKLYVAGRTPKSAGTIKGIIKLLEDAADGDYNLKIIDVVEHLQLAKENNILATPVLEEFSPKSTKIIVRNISNKERFLSALRQTAKQKEDSHG